MGKLPPGKDIHDAERGSPKQKNVRGVAGLKCEV